jgi:Phosphotransferase enzyme family
MPRIAEWMLGGLPSSMDGARVVQERHRRDSSSLLLAVERAGRIAEAAVIYQRADGALRHWVYPNDPFLPALAQVVGGDLLCSADVWDRPWWGAGAPVLGRRLMYNPGQRAAFLVEQPGQPGRMVLKLLRAEHFSQTLARYLAFERAGLTRQGMVPGLISYAPSIGALLYRYVPGTPLDQLDATPDEPTIGAALADALVTIHAAAVPGLSRWDPVAEADRTRAMLGDLERWWPAAAHMLTPLLGEIGRRMADLSASGQLSHGDCTARNLLLTGSGRLAAIDWDSASHAPIERDLAAMVPALRLLGIGSARFLDTYQSQTARQIDQDLLGAFVQYQRLIKLARRAFRDGDSATARITAGAAQIAAMLG